MSSSADYYDESEYEGSTSSQTRTRYGSSGSSGYCSNANGGAGGFGEESSENGEYIDVSNSHNPMKRLFSFLLPFKGTLVVAATSSILNKVLDLMPPLLVAWIVDTVQGSPPDWLVTLSMDDGDNPPTKGSYNLPLALGILTVAIFFFESLFQWIYELAFKRLAQDAQHASRMASFGKIQEREIAFFERHRAGDLLSLFNDDVNTLERFLNTGINDILQYFVTFAFAGAVMFAASWELSLIAFTPAPLILIGSYVFQRVIQPRYAAVRQNVGALGAKLENSLAGIMVVKAFTAEDVEYSRVGSASQKYRDSNWYAIKVSALYVPVIRMSISLGFAAVIVFGAYWTINEERGMTVAKLVLFSMLTQRVLWPITRLGRTVDEFMRARASARRVFALLDEDSTIVDPDTPLLFPAGGKKKGKKGKKGKSGSKKGKGKVTDRATGDIVFDSVSFAYESTGLQVLKSVSFRIKAGQTIGIAGATGSGKSTLIKLLLRLYDVDAGSISLDSVDIRDLKLDVLRRNIALVSQDSYLFHGTIAENLMYGSHVDDTAFDRVVEACKHAKIYKFIKSLPDEFATIVGERGVRLSGGQRQRLSIARALIKSAPVLIFDEATASVDTATETALQKNLDKLTQDCTAIIIAHRLSTIRKADHILVVDSGRIVEKGTHDDLVGSGGKYASLWAVQTGDVDHSASSYSSSGSLSPPRGLDKYR